MSLALLVSSALSLAGDLIPIVAHGLSHHLRHSLTARLLTCFAVADAAGQIAILVASLDRHLLDNPSFCTLQAAANWFSVWASWLWTVAFAHAVRHSFMRTIRTPHLAAQPGQLDAKGRAVEMRWHVVCWLLPLAIVAILAALDQFEKRTSTGGHGMPLPVCSLEPRAATIASTPVFLALAYNVFAFFSVDRLMHQTAHASSEVIDPATRVALARSLRPRFTLYVLIFVVSQTPEVVVDLISSIDSGLPHRSAALRSASTATMVLAQLHGFFNGVAFSWVNRRHIFCCAESESAWSSRRHHWYRFLRLTSSRPPLDRPTRSGLSSPLFTADYSATETPRLSEHG